MDLQGKNVVITGASQGIGLACARAFSGAGARVIVAARNREKLDDLAKEIDGAAFPVDLLDPEQVDSFIPRVEETHGPIDVLMNNAGIETIDSTAVVSIDALRNVCRLNLEAPMILTRCVLPGMLTRGSGHLVYTSSLAGTSAYPAIGPYAGTKAGLTNYASSVRSEVQKHGVGVTIVAPGPVDTDMWDQVEASSPSGKRVIRRFQRLQLIPKIAPERLAEETVAAVREGRRHVRHPKRLLVNFWFNEAPRKIAAAALFGVRFDPMERASGEQRH